MRWNEAVRGDAWSNLSRNNYKWGIEFSAPLFLRKERAAAKLAEVKIQEMQFDFNDRKVTLLSKARQAINAWSIMLDQSDLFRRTVSDASLLLGERQLFDAGESS